VLYDECQWGYYDDVEGVEGLLAWLNPKGAREAKLRQAILSRKESMYKLMEARDKVPPPATYGYGGNVDFSIYVLRRSQWR
jgi:hypothetical protein